MFSWQEESWLQLHGRIREYEIVSDAKGRPIEFLARPKVELRPSSACESEDSQEYDVTIVEGPNCIFASLGDEEKEKLVVGYAGVPGGREDNSTPAYRMPESRETLQDWKVRGPYYGLASKIEEKLGVHVEEIL